MRLGDSNFFNLFQRLASRSNEDRDRDEWSVAGVCWRRQRHVHWSSVSWQIDLRHTTRPNWTLIFVHELWWNKDRRKSIRNARWAHVEVGDRRNVLNWFEDRQSELE